ncbi:cell division protein FtsZ [Moheibacter sediminis]|uniref:Cell division protein FtsZ n=1 Tax=Moheibacter sediminis TaxID=1434700 RepID=A0A1W2CS61_9FLAO|nr:cell division protein FtsZ [Moheibacter sediminis]SMC87774.1 cell division protein FtsZ [Moheibacter sediminis]
MSTGDFMFDLPKNRSSAIKVIGVGGGGSNAVNYMHQQGITGVDFVVCNTDAQALNNSPVPNRVQLGQSTTEGLGAGANPEVGEQAALESIEDIKKFLDVNTKMVFITAGMGGGTGTGAAPIIAGISKELGILTVGICTAPFYFEGKMRLEQAERGIEKLRNNVDSLIVINNDKLRELYGNLGYKDAFTRADEVLTTAAKGIAEVITKHYATNIDLKDARTVLADSGTAIMGTGKASGENKAREAIVGALDSPLLNNNKISGAKNVLLLIVSGENEVTMDEIGTINDYIQTEAGNNANIIMGIGEDMELGDKISVTVVATGFPTEDQIFTGKEEEKVFHRLEEEQPLIQKLSHETPFPVHVKKIKDIEEPQMVQPVETQTQQVRSEEPQQVKFFLEEEAPKVTKPVVEDAWEPQLKSEMKVQQPLFEEEIVFEQNYHFDEPVNEVEETIEEEFTETVMFTLDDDFEEETIEEKQVFSNPNQQTEPEVKKEIRIEEEINPTDSPISQSLSQAIEERRARLKQFNYKFKNTLSNKSVDEVESIPAYKRQGIELNERDYNSPSDLVVGKDSSNELKIRPNNFLHDNVD